MNIQKNEILLLDKTKFNAAQNIKASAASLPVAEMHNDNGMNALSFMGMKNLLSNPSLAKQVGVDGDETAQNAPAFKGGMKNKVATAALVLASLGATAFVSSCQKQEVDVDFSSIMDMFSTLMNELTAQYNAMKEEFKSMHKDMNEGFSNLQAKYDKMYNLIQGMQDAVIDAINNGVSDVKASLTYIQANQDTMIELMDDHFESEAEAREWFKQQFELLQEKLDIGQLTMDDIRAFMDSINDRVINIDNNVSMLLEAYQQAQERIAEHEKNVENKLANIEKYTKATAEDVKVLTENTDSIIKQNNTMIETINTISEDVKINNKISEDAKKILIWNGYTQAQIARMSVYQITTILNEIADNTKETNNKLEEQKASLDAIYQEIVSGKISAEEAAQKIINLLKAINYKLSSIMGMLHTVIQNQNKYGKEARQFYYQNHKDAQALIKAVYKNYGENKAQNARLDSLISIENSKYALADSLINVIQNGNDNIVSEIRQQSQDIEEAFKIHNMHDEMRKEELVSLLKQWQTGEYLSDMESLKNQKILIGLIEKYGSLLINTTDSNKGVIDAINALMKQEKAADEAAAKQQEVDTAAIIAAINNATNALEDLRRKADEIINKLNTQINLAQTYGDKVLAAINENTKAVNALHFETIDLSVLVEYLKSLQENSKQANTYLSLILKKNTEIGEQIANLEAIAGKALTADELRKIDEEFFNRAKAYFNTVNVDFKTFLETLHNEGIDKANEIITYLQQGNKIAKDTYDLVAAWAAKADKDNPNYTTILKQIYDYLPNLICDCKCKEDVNTNEGIKGDIEDLLG